MDATSVIIERHADLERAFADYDGAEGSHRRQVQALGSIARELAVHSTVEHDVLYPAIRGLTGRHDRRIDRHLEQTHLLELLLLELRGMLPADRRFDAKVGLLGELFRQHARDQELELLPELRRRLESEERERLGDDLLERTRQLDGTPARAERPLRVERPAAAERPGLAERQADEGEPGGVERPAAAEGRRVAKWQRQGGRAS